MTPLIQLRNFSIVALSLACFTVPIVPKAFGVVPAPDGGYPGGNTAEGQDALLSLTTGGYNTAVGFLSLRTDSTSGLNTAIGAGALFANTADANTATGAGALLLTTSGSQNTATGALALLNNTTGESNTASGFDALFINTEGAGNTANGAAALFGNTTGGGNTAVGAGALFANTTGGGNTAVGVNAYSQEDDGQNNTAIGVNAGSSCTGTPGVANNTSVGANAYGGCDRTTTVGANASGGLVLNTVVGFQANGGDTQNTVMGAFAASNLTVGAFNVICIGAFAGSNLGSASNVISIGADGQNVDNSCYIGNIWNQPGGTQPVYVNSDGKLGAQVSSRRFKDEVKPIKCASEVIYELKPVSFRYKPEIEPTRPRGFGLVAEDVQNIDPDLVTRDSDGNALSVRYDAVNAMLLNEFLKEHRKVQRQAGEIHEQRTTIAKLKSIVARQGKEMQALAAHLREQDSKIQKVSAQIEMSMPASQVVTSDR
jgi:trimeric autotransporter adhesin